jgi:hypothetical protein
MEYWHSRDNSSEEFPEWASLLALPMNTFLEQLNTFSEQDMLLAIADLKLRFDIESRWFLLQQEIKRRETEDVVTDLYFWKVVNNVCIGVVVVLWLTLHECHKRTEFESLRTELQKNSPNPSLIQTLHQNWWEKISKEKKL